MKYFLKWTLTALCGAGILISWLPQDTAWHVFESSTLALAFLWILAWTSGKAHARFSWVLLLPLGVIAWGLFQLHNGWSVYPFATQLDILRWATWVSVLFVAFQVFESSDDARKFGLWFTVFALAVSLLAILQYVAHNGRVLWIMETTQQMGFGPFLNRDHYASFMLLAIPFAMLQAIRDPRRGLFFGVAAAAMYASVILSASRAGSALATLELVLFLVQGFANRRRAVSIVVLVAAFVAVVGWQPLYERFQAHDPYAGRREVVQASLKMMQARPWTGFGLGTWTSVYPAYAEKDFGVFINAAHNDWLQWGDDGGIPMLLCVFLLFAVSVWVAWKLPWGLGVPAVFLHCLIDFPMQGRFLPATLFLVYGILLRQAHNRGHDSPFRSVSPGTATAESAEPRSKANGLLE
jgi:O-antigen ligase